MACKGCGGRHQVTIYSPTYTPDKKGGKVRAWSKLKTLRAMVTFQSVSDGVTGEMIVERQQAQFRDHRNTPIEQGHRAEIGGVEFSVIGVDPKGPGNRRKVYCRRVEHEGIADAEG